MRWFRVNRRWGGQLALMALALQLTLSFAHIHAEDFVPANPAATQLQADAAGAATSHQDGDGEDRDRCAVCAILHLAGSLVLTPPPAIALPVAAEPVWLTPAARYSLPVQHHLPQARAPPQA